MKTAERRNAILKLLQNAEEPVAARKLAERYGVSRQVIVQDMAVIKKRRTHSCKPFFLDSRNIFLTDSFIFCFIVILCTTHMMAGTVITGDCTAILHHSGAKFFCYNFNSAFSAQPLLTEHRDCQFSFHIIRILLSSVLSSLS